MSENLEKNNFPRPLGNVIKCSDFYQTNSPKPDAAYFIIIQNKEK